MQPLNYFFAYFRSVLLCAVLAGAGAASLGNGSFWLLQRLPEFIASDPDRLLAVEDFDMGKRFEVQLYPTRSRFVFGATGNHESSSSNERVLCRLRLERSPVQLQKCALLPVERGGYGRYERGQGAKSGLAGNLHAVIFAQQNGPRDEPAALPDRTALRGSGRSNV